MLNTKVKNIKIQETIKLNNILEYEFWISKALIELENGNFKNILFRFINNDKIKESVYCYWNICMENFLNNIQQINTNNSKVVITQEENTEYKNAISIKLCDKTEREKYYETKVYLVNIVKYLTDSNIDLLNEYKEYKNKILLIGITS